MSLARRAARLANSHQIASNDAAMGGVKKMAARRNSVGSPYLMTTAKNDIEKTDIATAGRIRIVRLLDASDLTYSGVCVATGKFGFGLGGWRLFIRSFSRASIFDINRNHHSPSQRPTTGKYRYSARGRKIGIIYRSDEHAWISVGGICRACAKRGNNRWSFLWLIER